MSEVTPPNNAPDASPSNVQQLISLFQKVLPLVYGIASKLRWALIIGVAMLAWIAVWLVGIKGFSLGVAAVVVGIGAIPLLIILRFWWSLEELKDLPSILNNMVGDAKAGLVDTVNEVKAGNIKKVGFLGSAKGLWSIGSMLSEAKGLLGSYVGIATLINPFSLIMGVLSIIAIGLVAIIGVILAVVAII
ncbi:hypothetical protein [Thiofilum flexile]|uniref:hypothetical protein n=1 Tax=Thiofilum flexile TaxID=125627 RepID=UPI000369F66F|nr:hypothetical protein [Thiofilum flexile]